jgi:hypothetical protein
MEVLDAADFFRRASTISKKPVGIIVFLRSSSSRAGTLPGRGPQSPR